VLTYDLSRVRLASITAWRFGDDSQNRSPDAPLDVKRRIAELNGRPAVLALRRFKAPKPTNVNVTRFRPNCLKSPALEVQ
jgi:hypothetical protein